MENKADQIIYSVLGLILFLTWVSILEQQADQVLILFIGLFLFLTWVLVWSSKLTNPVTQLLSSFSPYPSLRLWALKPEEIILFLFSFLNRKLEKSFT